MSERQADPNPQGNDASGSTGPEQSGSSGQQDFRLDERYTRTSGKVALTGIQALVRLPMEQYRRDLAAGLRVGTYVSGYQGSPLGELDKQFRGAGSLLREHHIQFEAGINEDVAATAIYGTQFLEKFPHSRYDGITGIWYGKGPGVDRTGDAFRHGNFVGTSRHGAMLALGGDDPSCKSSTIPSDTIVSFFDLNMPQLFPGDPQEVLDLGLHAIAMSRYSGLWTALKIVTNVADGGSILDISTDLAPVRLPQDYLVGGKPYEKVQDVRLIAPYSNEIERMITYDRMGAALAYARVNGLDRVMVASESDQIGLVSAGKTYVDLVHALDLLGLDDQALRQAGIRIYKLGMIAPIEPQGLARFAQGLEEILFVEEKRGFSEVLARNALYNEGVRPRIFGKYGADGHPLFPVQGELGADSIAVVLADYLAERLNRPDLRERVRWLTEIDERRPDPVMARTPYFCSGCPHNTSTQVPEGSLVGGGIGCHAMAIYMDRGLQWLPQMGGEGACWLGLAPFVDQEHIFQNVGDGTFFHSASKALEACIAGGATMTYRILFNAAVAMTGGQGVVGSRTPLELAYVVDAMGAKQVVIVAESMEPYGEFEQTETITVRPKKDYTKVMAELKQVPGVTVIIFDQQCAAEKRRARKRGRQATPRQRVYINSAVCEGCGDCGVQSNCLSVVPQETDYGRKTQVHQSSCNMDYSCLKGDCPSFMTVTLDNNTLPRKKQGVATGLPEHLPEPANKVDCNLPYKAMLIGIGGTGVVTVDALLVTAALLEGKYAVNLDQTGLSQKGGAVLSNFTVSSQPIAHANKIAAGEAHLVLGFDLLASVSPDNLRRYHPERTVAVVNTAQISTAQVVTDVRAEFPELMRLQARLNPLTRQQGETNAFLDSEAICEALFGDHMPNNIFLLGVAYQKGLLPLEATSIEQAIRLNGVAVDMNLTAFAWGRQYTIDPEAVQRLLRGETKAISAREAAYATLREQGRLWEPFLESMEEDLPASEALRNLLYPRLADLMLHSDSRVARAYLNVVSETVEAESSRTPGRTELGEAVARWYFKLLAYKDEYEVARLWLADPLWREVAEEYQGGLRRFLHLHPPVLRAMGMMRKLKLPGWLGMGTLRLLKPLKGLRGTRLDPFGYAKVRREERRLIGWYRDLIAGLLPALTHENHALAVQIACLPDAIRGYEHIKLDNIAAAEQQAQELLERFQQPAETRAAG